MSARVLFSAVAWAAIAGCGEPVAIIGDPPGIARIVAGIPDMQGETLADRATESQMADPTGVAISNEGTLFIVEERNARLLAVASDGSVEVVRSDFLCRGDGCLERPGDVFLDPDGRPVVADPGARRIWRVDPESGSLTVLAGDGEEGNSPDGTDAVTAPLGSPTGVVVDMDGTVYFSERTGHRIRFIDGSGRLATLAGDGTDGFSGDGGDAAEAQLSAPGGLGLAGGILYVADSGNDRIRAIDLDSGVITTVAGNGTRGFTEDGVPADQSALNVPEDVTATPDGRRIFIADTRNHRIRHVPLDTNLIETFVGTGGTDFTGDLLDAGATSVASPSAVSTGPFGFLFVADPGHDVAWRIALGF